MMDASLVVEQIFSTMLMVLFGLLFVALICLMLLVWISMWLPGGMVALRGHIECISRRFSNRRLMQLSIHERIDNPYVPCRQPGCKCCPQLREVES